jgi:fermentation-respiration switch protein FrsA (DUF1100 family)
MEHVTREGVQFAAEGPTLRGWLYRPSPVREPAPIIVMTHGWGAVKEMFLDSYAEAFAAAGLAALVYDHRSFGESDGEPRQEIDPWHQVRDYRHAITYAGRLDGIDRRRIGIWGTSYSGGHALVLGAIDRRVRCVVAQCPTISGSRNTLRRFPGDSFTEQRKLFDLDRERRWSGERPAMVPILSDLTLRGDQMVDSFEFEPVGNQGALWFGRMRCDRLARWRNELTLRSLELYSEYEPGECVARIAPTPLLIVSADGDTLTHTDEILRAYQEAREPKRLVLLKGGHYDLYGTGRKAGTTAAIEWFSQYLT